MSPVTSRRIICREGDAGQSQAAFLAAFLAVILVIVAVIVALAPVIGGSAANYWLCQLLGGDQQACVEEVASGDMPENVGGIVPGEIPVPEEDCIVIPGPYAQPPVCTTEDGEVSFDIDLGDTPEWAIQPMVDDVNEAGGLGNYMDQLQDDYPLEGIPPIPTDFDGYIEVTDDGISVNIPNDEVHAELSWWVSGMIATVVGLSLGFLIEGLCMAALVPVPPPGVTAKVVCGALRGFTAGFMGTLLYNILQGKPVDAEVWGHALINGLIGAVGTAVWESGVNHFFRETFSQWIRNSVGWVRDGLVKFGGWIGGKAGEAAEAAGDILTQVGNRFSRWWEDAVRDVPNPGGNAAAQPGGAGRTAGGKPLMEAYLRMDGTRPSQTRIASERERTPSLV